MARVSVVFSARLQGRARIFRTREVVYPLLALLEKELREQGCIAPAYCFLPSEIRIVVTAPDDPARPREAFRRFKDAAAAWFRSNRLPAWEESHFGHELKSRRDHDAAVLEVLGLPLERKVGPRLRERPFVGSLHPESITG